MTDLDTLLDAIIQARLSGDDEATQRLAALADDPDQLREISESEEEESPDPKAPAPA